MISDIRHRSLLFADSQLGTGRSLAIRRMREILATAYEAGAEKQSRIINGTDDGKKYHQQWDPATAGWLAPCDES